MILIDTHCHLYADEFAGERPEVIARAEQAGVSKFYLPSIDSSSFSAMLDLESEFPGRCMAMVGLHPCSVQAEFRKELTFMEEHLSKRRFAAIGEIGLDFYWSREYDPEQYEAFERQIDWALHYHLPIVIHSRDSLSETIRIVAQKQTGGLVGIFHCFTGNLQEAMQITEMGFFLGVGGVLTFKNSKLRETLKPIGLKHLVLETDSPYLAPVPFRGKRNESSYLRYIVDKLAALKDVRPEEIARITTENAEKIFAGVETKW
jgi:TatD DNase family protein